MRNRHFNVVTIFLVALLFGFSAYGANAAQIVVTSTGDPDNTAGSCAVNGTCSLRQAINAAASGDNITFNITAANCTTCTINLVLGGLIIDKSLTITGSGARNLIIRRADGTNPLNFTIFNLTSVAPVTINISGLAIVNGSSMGAAGGIGSFGPVQLNLNGVSVSDSAGFAGGIYNDAGNVTILNSVISNNVGQVGGIFNNGVTLNIANSTISNNRGGTGAAGGILNGTELKVSPTLNMNNVTITGNVNEADDFDNVGGIRNYGTVNTRNTIISNNSSDSGYDDIRGLFISQGNNLVSSLAGGAGFGFPGSGDILAQGAVLFGPGNFGGQTNTYAISNMVPFNSPAVDTGNNCVVTGTGGVNNPPVRPCG